MPPIVVSDYTLSRENYALPKGYNKPHFKSNGLPNVEIHHFSEIKAQVLNF